MTYDQINEKADGKVDAIICNAVEMYNDCKEYYTVYEHAKSALKQYVGWEAKNPEIATEDAWEAVIKELDKRLGEIQDCIG